MRVSVLTSWCPSKTHIEICSEPKNYDAFPEDGNGDDDGDDNNDGADGCHDGHDDADGDDGLFQW